MPRRTHTLTPPPRELRPGGARRPDPSAADPTVGVSGADRRAPTLRRHLMGGVCVGALLLAGCHSGTEAAPSAPPATVKDAAYEHVEAFAAHHGELLTEHASEAQDEGGLATALEQRRSSGELGHAELVKKILEHDGQHFRFIHQARLTRLGQTVFEALESAPAHGIEASALRLPRLEASVKKLEAEAASLRSSDAPPLTEAEKDELASLIRERGPADRKEAEELLLAALVRDGGDSPAPEVTAWYRSTRDKLSGLASLAADVEVMLTDALLEFAWRMRFSNPQALPPESVAGKGHLVAAGDQMMGFVARLREPGAQPDQVDGSAVTRAIDGLLPSTPQYARLVDALGRYRKIQAQGGWPTDYPAVPVPRPREAPVRYSQSSKTVPDDLVRLTKQRLSAEGFYHGAIDDQWSDDLNDALLAFRATHQLWDRPWIDWELVDAMRIPVEYRIAQIEVTLQRWRESRIGRDDYYIYVNIPDFHAEVWDGGERKMRFRVIVGKPTRYKDRDTGQWKYPNATPIFSARMESVVFAPYWNVPYRIKTKELDPKLDKSPTWYEDNGFEVYASGSGQEMVRQKPGPNNALGRVKLLFPNDHDVYIHDTQDKTLFDNPVRAYSHGCMRAQDPLDLAKYVLARESDFWDDRRIRSYGAARAESWQRLQAGPMVHIEYRTVRVDDEGRVHFLTDVYRFDAERIKAEKGLDVGLVD